MTTINKEISINKSIEAAWKVLGLEFAQADKWASSVKHSEARDTKSFKGSSCSERGCEIPGMGSIKEKLLKYSDTDYLLSYQVYDGMPVMVKFMSNTWQLHATSANSCKLTMKMEMKTGRLMGVIMKPMIKMQMSGMANKIVEDFKYYLENGKPHPRKIKSLKK